MKQVETKLDPWGGIKSRFVTGRSRGRPQKANLCLLPRVNALQCSGVVDSRPPVHSDRLFAALAIVNWIPNRLAQLCLSRLLSPLGLNLAPQILCVTTQLHHSATPPCSRRLPHALTKLQILSSSSPPSTTTPPPTQRKSVRDFQPAASRSHRPPVLHKHPKMSDGGNGSPMGKPEEAQATEHLNIKVTDNNNEVFFKIKRSTALKKLMDAFCERQGKAPNSVRFLFDGTRVNGTDTPDGVSSLLSFLSANRPLNSEP